MLEIKNSKFYLNGKEYLIKSGAIHYFRVPKIYWEDRLKKLKDCGLNTVETYVAWGYHEPKDGVFDFQGEKDFREFIKIAEKLELNVILRPGPFICAEYDFGGFPYWLLKDRNIKLRTYDEKYLFYVERFFKQVFDYLKDCFSSVGGNIIAVQVENEYGSFANNDEYLSYLTELIKKLGIKELLFTSDGAWNNMISGGIIDSVLPTLNMGIGELNNKFDTLKPFRNDIPYMCMEYWCGWFTRWGQKVVKKSVKKIKEDIKYFLENNISFNLYMFHGGTNFGFDGGANFQKYYTPTTTSYDYAAPLSEDGSLTELYHAIREAIFEFENKELTKLDYQTKTQEINNVSLTKFSDFFENIDLISKKYHTKSICSMEDVDLRHGMILYSKILKGEYSTSIVTIEEVHDNAYIYINDKLKKTCYRIANQKSKYQINKKIPTFKYIMPGFKNELKIDILVESYGRVNYGRHIYDRKGIKNFLIGDQHIFGWDIKAISFDEINKLKYKDISNLQELKYPVFLKGEFKANINEDTYLKLDGFKKGIIFVNGKNIGRYNHIGPQTKYYIPKNFLKENNEIVIFETEETKNLKINFVK